MKRSRNVRTSAIYGNRRKVGVSMVLLLIDLRRLSLFYFSFIAIPSVKSEAGIFLRTGELITC